MEIRPHQMVHCAHLSCPDVETRDYLVCYETVETDAIRLMLVADHPPEDPFEYFYARGDSPGFQHLQSLFAMSGIFVQT